MSDVPCAAAWAAAVGLLLRGSTLAAFGSGASASVAIAIRPNLAPIAVVLALWRLWFGADRDGRERGRGRAASLAFVLGAVPGCLLVAWYNNALYGGPLASGYGDLGKLFSTRFIPVNVWRYGTWLVETQTALALLGIASLVSWTSAWTTWLWPTPSARRAAVLLAGVLSVVWASYLAYTPFDAWWFSRFLLPSWPAMAVGMAAFVIALVGRRGQWGRLVAGVVLGAVGLQGLAVAARNDVFPVGEGERRYATVAELVAQHTEPSSVILTGLHAGSILYYSGRVPMRVDLLDPQWLDQAVAWLAREGRHPYVLIEDWEMPAFERRFATQQLGQLVFDPLLAYQAYRIPGTIYLFDPLRPRGPTHRPAPIADPQPRCAPPAATTSPW